MPLPGDYNNGTVDAADYVLWRKSPSNFAQPRRLQHFSVYLTNGRQRSLPPPIHRRPCSSRLAFRCSYSRSDSIRRGSRVAASSINSLMRDTGHQPTVVQNHGSPDCFGKLDETGSTVSQRSANANRTYKNDYVPTD